MFMLKLAALPLAAFALVSASPAPENESWFVRIPAVQQVWCQHSAGTAFTVNGHVVSVTHVTSADNCRINGLPIVGVAEGNLDFSVIANSPLLRGFRINCGGFKLGETYFAVGYARALPTQRMIRLTGTGQHSESGMAILLGYPTVIPGMSGGVIFNMRAEAVGTVNMYSMVAPLSLSRELKDTSVCHT
jgi:hypothetical protein